jgi:uncharacterized protein (TIGR03437 family)
VRRYFRPGFAVTRVLAFVLFGWPAFSQDVLTGGYDNARTNANLAESILTPSTVQPSAFGELFSLSVDGQIYAQPLYRQNLTIPGKGTHNVVFVATMHNSVYAFDADTPSTPLWTVNLGPSVPASNYLSDTGAYSDIDPENGILGTPVIDPATGTLYAVAATLENKSYIYRLHALDTATGGEKFSGPATIAAQVPGTGDSSVDGKVPFVASQHIQRPALLLVNGIVYISFGSHGDAVPYHGWVLGYSAANVQRQMSVFNPTPLGSGGAIWQAGRGPSADDNGNIFVVTSNGDTDDAVSFSDSVVRLNSSANGVADYFAPADVQMLNGTDDDLGSAGAMLIPGTNLLVTGGKQGVIYLLDKTGLGHSTANDGQIVQSIDTGNFGFFNMALWNRSDGPLVYLHSSNQPVNAYRLSGNQLSVNPVAQSVDGFNVPYQGMTISANGSNDGSGVLWVLAPTSYPLPSHGVLHAYNAGDLTELWNSDMSDQDSIGGFVKFANPTVVAGKVYAPTMDNQLLVYGVTAPAGGDGSGPVITGIVNAASYADGPVAPGEIVAILGQGLGPTDVVTGAFDATGSLPGQLQGTQVTFNGVPAPVIYTSDGAVAAIVPYEISGADNATVLLSYNGASAAPQILPLAVAAPGIFSGDASGSGAGAILNADYTLNTPDNPAQGGSVVVVYATGGGPTNPPASTGTITHTATALSSNVMVTVDGQPAQVLYAGNAGGEVAGAIQLNLLLPTGITGQVPIIATVNNQPSQSTVTVSVK